MSEEKEVHDLTDEEFNKLYVLGKPVEDGIAFAQDDFGRNVIFDSAEDAIEAVKRQDNLSDEEIEKLQIKAYTVEEANKIITEQIEKRNAD